MAAEPLECRHCGYDLSHAGGVICPECGGVIERRPLLPRAPRISGASLLLVVGFGLLHPILVAVAMLLASSSWFGVTLWLVILSPWSALLMIGDALPMALVVGVLVGPFYGTAIALARWSGIRRAVAATITLLAVLHLGAIIAALAWR